MDLAGLKLGTFFIEKYHNPWLQIDSSSILWFRPYGLFQFRITFFWKL
jgi:hypothetical protein